VARLDTDHDGKISAAEAAAAGTTASTQIMAADKDNDGFVTADELREWEQAQRFDRLDRDDDGFLSATEIGRHRDLLAADTDADGKVSLQEYQAHLAAAAARVAAQQAAVQAFQAADADNDRKLSAAEWPASATATFTAVDADADGFVTPREIGAYMRANSGTSPI